MIPRVADLAKRPSSSSQVPHPHRRDNYNDSSSRQASKEPYKAPSLSGYPPSKRKKSPRSLDIVNSPGQKSSLSPQQGSKESPKSPSVSGSSSLTRRNLPRSQELNKSSSSSLGSLSLARKKPPRSSESGNSSFGGGSSALKRNTDVSTKQESPRKAQELKATNVKFLEEIVTLREHVGEEGEVTYHIPKQQFEDLSQGVQDVLHDLHSIKSALNIQDDDE